MCWRWRARETVRSGCIEERLSNRSRPRRSARMRTTSGSIHGTHNFIVGYGSGALATIDPASATVEHGRVDVEDLRTALARLPDVQREAVLLVGASGFSYEEAAQIMCVAVVTVKSRVNRARVSLAAMLSVDD